MLSDPKNDRRVKTVNPPPHRPLSKELMWGKSIKIFRILKYSFCGGQFKCV